MGKTVSLSLRLWGLSWGVTLKGKLLEVGESGVLIELPKGQTFIPVSSILHVTLQEGA